MANEAKKGFLVGLMSAVSMLTACGDDNLTVTHHAPLTGFALQENREPLALKYLADQGYASIERGRTVYHYNEMSGVYMDCYLMIKAGDRDDGHRYEGCVVTDPNRKTVMLAEVPKDGGTRFNALQVKSP